MLQQASRRVKRSVEDHALIQDLRSQLERAQERAECKRTSMRGRRTCAGCKPCTGREESSRSTSWHSRSDNSKPPPFDTRKRSYESTRPMRSHSFSSLSTRRRKVKRPHSRSESRTDAIATSARTRVSWRPSGRVTRNFASSWLRRPRSTSGCFAIATSPLRTSRRQSREPDVREPSFQTEMAPSLGWRINLTRSPATLSRN